MNYLSVENLSKRFADKPLFEDVTFGLDQGQKTAIVGINGAGKSTLFNILMGKESADSGKFNFNKKIKVRMLPQEPAITDHHSILDYVLSGDDEVSKVVRKYEHALSSGYQDKLDSLIEKMEQLHAWDFESQAKQILGKLGIHDLSSPADTLSGGQQKRVALAKLLIEQPDLLLLDEPTNHLDLEVIEWLEQYLAQQKMSLLLVTHDRYFLEAVTNDILELDNGRIYRYKGSYSYFLEKKIERSLNEARVVEKAKNLMRKELEWMRRQPKARTTKAKYRLDAFAELEKTAKGKAVAREVNIALSGSRLGKKILEIKHLSKSFADKTLISDFSYTFKKGDRIGIIGNNGSGKTTFLKLITKAIAADSGEIIQGETVVFGYYTQDTINFNPGDKVIDVVKNVAEVIELGDGSHVTATQLLTQFNFSPKKQYDFVEKLSGGEKRRLQLLQVLMGNPNFLILDEPTNDLDLITLNTLEDYLLKFGGCLIVVSHDRYFIDRLVDHLFVFDGLGSIKNVPGNFTDYRTSLVGAKKAPAAGTGKPAPKKSKPTKKKLSFNEKREFERLEDEIAVLEQEIEVLNKKLTQANDDYAQLTTWGKQLAEIKAEIAKKEDRWLELAELA
jgi:ABC transport system ATP-binding/permease protein